MKRKGLDRNGILRSILHDEDESESESDGYDEDLDDDERFVQTLVKKIKKQRKEETAFPEESPTIFVTQEDEAEKEARQAKEMEEKVRRNRLLDVNNNNNKQSELILDKKSQEILNMIRKSKKNNSGIYNNSHISVQNLSYIKSYK